MERILEKLTDLPCLLVTEEQCESARLTPGGLRARAWSRDAKPAIAPRRGLASRAEGSGSCKGTYTCPRFCRSGTAWRKPAQGSTAKCDDRGPAGSGPLGFIAGGQSLTDRTA